MSQDPGPLWDLGEGAAGTKGQPLQGTIVTRVNLFQLCSVILSPQLRIHIPGRKCLMGLAWAVLLPLAREGLVVW